MFPFTGHPIHGSYLGKKDEATETDLVEEGNVQEDPILDTHHHLMGGGQHIGAQSIHGEGRFFFPSIFLGGIYTGNELEYL